MNNVILKPGKDKPIRRHHHWIFSGAIQSALNFTDGEILGVQSSTGDFLGYGYFHHQTSISGRMLSFDQTPGEQALLNNIDNAIAYRNSLITQKQTNAYRLVNSEGDGIPGLVIDKYDDVLVIQVATLGIERLKPLIVQHLEKTLKPKSIYEKSSTPGRREEGLNDQEGLLFGGKTVETPRWGVFNANTDPVEIKENNLKFLVDIVGGQKTGFFLDQREMRQWVRELSANKTVLNCFGYTGGFSVYALAGGAKEVTTVDISADAIAIAEKNIALNKFKQKTAPCVAADAFQYLREHDLHFDLIILDPPAFAKRKTDVVQACRGYKDINRLAIQKIPAGGLVLTSSCSYHVDEKLFQQVVFQAASEANRRVRIIGRHRLAIDHPINIFHPEGEYLKSLLLFVE